MEFGKFTLTTRTGNHNLDNLFIDHFFAELKPSFDDEWTAIQSLIGTQMSRANWELLPKRSYSIHELEAGPFRISFEKLEAPHALLEVTGECGIDDMGEFYIEGQSDSGYLVTLFLNHFFRDNLPCDKEDIEDCEAVLGVFRLKFEPLLTADR